MFGGGKPLFGQSAVSFSQNSLFGTTTQTASSLFGQTTTASTSTLFGGQVTSTDWGISTIGTIIPFIPTSSNEAQGKTGRFMCITAMDSYPDKSFEEFRLEDYMSNRRGPNASTSGSMLFSSFAQRSTPFSSTSTFGQPNTLFGSNAGTSSSVQPLFGQSHQSRLFGSGATGSLFGSNSTTSGLNFNQNASIFGKPIFGSAVTTSSSTSLFGGGNQTFSLFNQTTPFGAQATTSTSLFGNTASSGLFGVNKPGGPGSLFGPSTTNQSLFGSSTTKSSLFGTSTTTQSLFGPSPANQSLFGPSPANQSLFGPTTTTNSLFGNFATNSFKSNSLFGPTTTTTFAGFNTFGQQPSLFAPANSGTTGLGFTMGGNTSTGIFGQQSSLFGPKSTQSLFGSSTSSSFGNTGIFGNTGLGNSFSTTGFGGLQSNTLGVGQNVNLAANLANLQMAQNIRAQQQILELVRSMPYGQSPLFCSLNISDNSSDSTIATITTATPITTLNTSGLAEVRPNRVIGKNAIIQTKAISNILTARRKAISLTVPYSPISSNTQCVTFRRPGLNNKSGHNSYLSQLFSGFDDDEKLNVSSIKNRNLSRSDRNLFCNDRGKMGLTSMNRGFFTPRNDWRRLHVSDRLRASILERSNDFDGFDDVCPNQSDLFDSRPNVTSASGDGVSLRVSAKASEIEDDNDNLLGSLIADTNTMREASNPVTNQASISDATGIGQDSSSLVIANSNAIFKASNPVISGASPRYRAKTSQDLSSSVIADPNVTQTNTTIKASEQVSHLTNSPTFDSKTLLKYSNILRATPNNRISKLSSIFDDISLVPGNDEKSVWAEALCVRLTRPGYYTLPTLDELIDYVDANNRCIVENFVVGRKNYGTILFSGFTDITGLNLDYIVHIHRREIIVYPDDDKKPPLGEGLNRPAIISLDRIWPSNEVFKRQIISLEPMSIARFEKRLEKACNRMDAKFIEYRPDSGSWVFQVKHFSKYHLEDSDGEADDQGIEVDNDKSLGKNVRQNLNFSSFADSNDDESIISFGSLHQIDDNASKFVNTTTVDLNSQKFDFHHNENTNWLFNYSNDLKRKLLTFTESKPFTIHLDKACYPIKNFQSLICDTGLWRDQCFQANWGFLNFSDYRAQVFITLNNEFSVSSCLKKSSLHMCQLIMAIDQLDEDMLNAALQTSDCFLQHQTSLLAPCEQCPHWRPKLGLDVLNKYISILGCDLQTSLDSDNHQEAKVNGARANNFRRIFGLCQALWSDHLQEIPEVDGCLKNITTSVVEQRCNAELSALHLLARKQAISEWIRLECQPWLLAKLIDLGISDRTGFNSHSYSPILSNSFDQDVSTESISEGIFACLVAGEPGAACRLALSAGMSSLGLILSQCTAGTSTHYALQLQIKRWHELEFDRSMPYSLLRVYCLLAGLTEYPDPHQPGEKLYVLYQLDWIQVFGVYLWYFTNYDTSVSDILVSFSQAWHLDQAVNSNVAIPRPCPPTWEKLFDPSKFECQPTDFPPYAKDFKDWKTFRSWPRDVAYHLLELVRNRNHNLFRTLDPCNNSLASSLKTCQRNSINLNDWTISWHLWRVLYSIGIAFDGSENQKLTDHICNEFAAQLEDCGLWEWAIFVSLHLVHQTNREVSVKAILGRHVSLVLPRKTTQSELEPPPLTKNENFVVTMLGVPVRWVHEAKAVLARYNLLSFINNSNNLSNASISGRSTFLHRINLFSTLEAAHWLAAGFRQTAEQVLTQYTLPNIILNAKRTVEAVTHHSLSLITVGKEIVDFLKPYLTELLTSKITGISIQTYYTYGEMLCLIEGLIAEYIRTHEDEVATFISTLSQKYNDFIDLFEQAKTDSFINRMVKTDMLATCTQLSSMLLTECKQPDITMAGGNQQRYLEKYLSTIHRTLLPADICLKELQSLAAIKLLLSNKN